MHVPNGICFFIFASHQRCIIPTPGCPILTSAEDLFMQNVPIGTARNLVYVVFSVLPPLFLMTKRRLAFYKRAQTHDLRCVQEAFLFDMTHLFPHDSSWTAQLYAILSELGLTVEPLKKRRFLFSGFFQTRRRLGISGTFSPLGQQQRKTFCFCFCHLACAGASSVFRVGGGAVRFAATPFGRGSIFYSVGHLTCGPLCSTSARPQPLRATGPGSWTEWGWWRGCGRAVSTPAWFLLPRTRLTLCFLSDGASTVLYAVYFTPFSCFFFFLIFALGRSVALHLPCSPEPTLSRMFVKTRTRGCDYDKCDYDICNCCVIRMSRRALASGQLGVPPQKTLSHLHPLTENTVNHFIYILRQ